MSRRRTRKEKEKATSKRLLILATPKGPSLVDPAIKIDSPAVTIPTNINKEEPVEPKYSAVKKDLLRTSISTVLALALELSVYYLLYSAHQARLPSGS